MEKIDGATEKDWLTEAIGRTAENIPDSFISISRLSSYIEEGKAMEAPRELVAHVLVEHETTILFGDTGLGKSILAMQIACQVAEQEARGGEGGRRNVLYVNFELSQQQLAKRYPARHLPDNLYIANIDYTLMHDVTDQSRILDEIQRTAVGKDIDVVIIDNLTNLCVNSKESNEAGNVMLRLLSLRMTHNWTMLILAHVPKRKPCDPLSLNDLAGSKMLSNLADNVVGLNKSKKGSDARYLIQLKYRSFAIELDSKNVLELRMATGQGWLHFETNGNGEERAHLPRNRDERADLEIDIVRKLKGPDRKQSYREIAIELGTSLATVHRTAKKYGLNSDPCNQQKSVSGAFPSEVKQNIN